MNKILLFTFSLFHYIIFGCVVRILVISALTPSLRFAIQSRLTINSWLCARAFHQVKYSELSAAPVPRHISILLFFSFHEIYRAFLRCRFSFCARKLILPLRHIVTPLSLIGIIFKAK